MLNAEQCFLDCINSPVRSVRARVELFDGSTLVNTFKYTDRLKSFTIERVGEGKFFGYGICQKLTVKLIDKDRELNITTANTLEAVFGTGCDYIYAFPAFKVSEVRRDENTNELSITAYDALYAASKYTVDDLAIGSYYTIGTFVAACGALLGIPVVAELEEFNTAYDGGANFEGTESIRDALNAVADATQTIYYIDSQWNLVFKRLDINGEAVLTIDREKYFTLDNSTSRRLNAIVHTTELGDSVGAEMAITGTTAYIRDNAFWELRNDIDVLVNNALAAVGGLTINQFECEWRGNYLLEIGDKIALVSKDNKTFNSYLLNDTISYDGSLIEVSRWEYDSDDAESESNPTSLGDALKQTFARVDKVNKQIDIVASRIEDTNESISSLQLTTDSITASVRDVEESVNNSYENLNNDINTLASQVEAKMSAEDVRLEISTSLANGAGKVITSTGFTFDEEGLTISKSGSEMETTITEDGMTVYRDEEPVLTANNIGVDAVNLHATTYLIVGRYSRFEDYGDGRTGCFWIGG